MVKAGRIVGGDTGVGTGVGAGVGSAVGTFWILATVATANGVGVSSAGGFTVPPVGTTSAVAIGVGAHGVGVDKTLESGAAGAGAGADEESVGHPST